MTTRPDGLPIPQRYWSMLTIAVGMAMSALDSSIANIALPTIARDLHAMPAETVWVVKAYQITILMFLLPVAALGERVGYSRIYRIGLGIFTIASLGCALSPNLIGLVAARITQGLGAACIMSMNGALVRLTYPKEKLGRGVGLNAMVVAAALTAGPTIAAGVLAIGRWEWLFAINVPVGIVNFVLASRALPRSDRAEDPFDLTSGTLNAAVFCAFFLGMDALAYKRASALIAAALAGAFVIGAGVMLVRREMAKAHSLVPVDLMRDPVFALSVIASVCSSATYTLAFVSLPFYLESVLHRSAVETGLLMTAWPIGVTAVSMTAGRMSDRVPAALLGSAGMLVLACGLALLAFLPDHASAATIVWRLALCGVGYGLFQAPNNRVLLSAAPRERTGAASGVLAASRLAGLSFGSTAAAMVFRLLPHRAETTALLLGLALAGAAAGASLIRSRPNPEHGVNAR